MNRIHIPALVDLLPVSDPAQIAMLADDVRLDRDYVAKGPLLNRIILSRIRKDLVWDGAPFPPVAPRGPARPLPAQAALEARLAEVVAGLVNDESALGGLAAYVRGDAPTGDAGPLAQQAVGRLFDPGYQADDASWQAALTLDAAPRSFNPLQILWWALTGAVPKARRLLADKVGGDPSGIHGTGVAVHNIVAGLQQMRTLWKDGANRRRLPPAGAAAHCLVAPQQVIRQPRKAGLCIAGAFEPTTLVMLQLDKAHTQRPTAEMAFMAQSWARCPAHAWVLALLAGTWRVAQEHTTHAL
ncbi:MAG TPA: hypothetical protein VN814_17575 [Caulobacteraceae bacterium]|nr:hypothetical protein [Caulobacteraceae bacterium]